MEWKEMNKQTRLLNLLLASPLGLALKAYCWPKLGVPVPKRGGKQYKIEPVRMPLRGLTGEEEPIRCHEVGALSRPVAVELCRSL